MVLTKPRQYQGYTLIEAVMVFLVVGILSGVIFNRTTGARQSGAVGQVVIKRDAVTTVDASNQAASLAQDIARIQALALNNGVPLRLSITYELVTYCDPSTTPPVCKPIRRNFKYDVTCRAVVSGTPCSAIGLKFRDPITGQDFIVSLEQMLSLEVKDGAGTEVLTVDFDSVGRPYIFTGSTATTGLITTNPVREFKFFADATQSAASGTATLKLRPITGFTELSY